MKGDVSWIFAGHTKIGDSVVDGDPMGVIFFPPRNSIGWGLLRAITYTQIYKHLF